MSDTPRTDAEAFTMGIMAAKPGERPKDFVRGDVARTLERELAELSAEFQSQNHELGKALHRADDAERENAALRDQVRELEAEIACLTVDEQDCDEDAAGDRTPNRDMHTVTDCNISIEEIERALGPVRSKPPHARWVGSEPATTGASIPVVQCYEEPETPQREGGS